MYILTVTFKGINWSRRRWLVGYVNQCCWTFTNIPQLHLLSQAPPRHTHLTHTHSPYMYRSIPGLHMDYTGRRCLQVSATAEWLIRIPFLCHNDLVTEQIQEGAESFSPFCHFSIFLDLLCQILMDHKYTHTKRGAHIISVSFSSAIDRFFFPWITVTTNKTTVIKWTHAGWNLILKHITESEILTRWRGRWLRLAHSHESVESVQVTKEKRSCSWCCLWVRMWLYQV